jgi:hypothetical protein
MLTKFLALGCISPLLASSQIPKRTVCELFENLSRYSGQVIEVTGVFQTNRHMSGLFAEDCATSFVTDGYRWPLALVLAATEVTFVSDNGGTKYTIDRTSSRTIREKIDAARGRKDVQVRVTIIGLVRSRQHYTPVRFGDGTLRYDGFGHEGAFPAEVVTIRWVRAEIVPVSLAKRLSQNK